MYNHQKCLIKKKKKKLNDIYDKFYIFIFASEDFHKNLRDLITKIALDNMNTWKTHSISTQGMQDNGNMISCN